MEYLLYLSVFFVLYAVLAWRDMPLAFAVFAGLLPSYLVRFNLGPLPSTALEGMVVILIARWFFLHGANRHAWLEVWQASKKSLFFWPGMLLVVASLAACFVSPDTRSALGIWRAYFLEPLIVYVLALNVLRRDQDWQRVFVALGCTTVALTGLALYQWATGQYLPTWEWTEVATRRATGLFTSPNALALFVVPVSMIALARVNIRAKWFPIITILAAVVSLLVGWSKGGMLAFLVGAAFVGWQMWSKKVVALGVAGLLTILMLLPATRAPILNSARFATPSGQSRLALYEGSLQLLRQAPLRGTGLSNFGEAFERVRPAEYTEKLIYPHNIALNFWLETGLVGLLAILWIAFTIIRAFLTRPRSLPRPDQRPQQAAIVGLTAALLTMLIHGLVDVPYFKNDLAMLTWLILAAFAFYTAKQAQSA